MDIMTIDIETYSDRDITKGVHKYVDSPSFTILLFAYAIGDGPVKVIDLTDGETIEGNLETYRALYSETVRKTAYNANFELTCLNAYFRRRGLPELDDRQWECDMVRACYNGYPPGLGITAKALGLEEDKQKDTRGKRLIQYFCKPCRPTKANGGRTRNLPEHAPEDWETFKTYNAQDVVTERAIREALHIPIPKKEWELWRMDRAINGRGIGIDRNLAEGAIAISRAATDELTDEARELTGLENPNSPAQLKEWLRINGHPVESLSKDAVKELLQNKNLHPKMRRMLEIRQKLGKTSIKKYQAMLDTVTTQDGRAHDLFQFYGTHTGRWAGRNIQLQNLPRNSTDSLDVARGIVQQGDYGTLDMMFDDVPDILSQLVRTALIPAVGHRFIVADFSAIEARVIAWAADVRWRREAFAEGKDIYCASASKMFGVPVVKHGVNGELRQKGKIAELALGYGGGVNALKAFGADKMGLSDAELMDIVTKWREASPEIPRLWSAIESAAFSLITDKWSANKTKRFCKCGGMFSRGKDGSLIMHLPSGRALVYPHARFGKNRFGKMAILYDGLNQTTRKWGAQETYGGKLTENFIQAVARDCLAAAMLRLERAGYAVVAHIHDEVVLDTPEGQGSLEDAIHIMTENEPWNRGLLMNADGFEAPYYKKD